MSGGVVTRSVLIPAGREEVWEALVDPACLEDWFADEVEGGELVPDGEVVFRWDGGVERIAVVEEADEPRRLVFRWAAVGGEESKVSFELVEDGPGTRVTVVESELTGRSAGGWAAGLPRLALAACLVAA